MQTIIKSSLILVMAVGVFSAAVVLDSETNVGVLATTVSAFGDGGSDGGGGNDGGDNGGDSGFGGGSSDGCGGCGDGGNNGGDTTYGNDNGGGLTPPVVTPPVVTPPVVTPPVATPPHIDYQCAADGKSVNVWWSGVSGASYYKPRIEGITAAQCSTLEGWTWYGGSQCIHDSYGAVSAILPLTLEGTHKIWVHAGSATSISGYVSTGTFSCPIPKLPPTCVIEAVPARVALGSNTELRWTTNNAQTATISSGVGSVAVGSGTRVVTPAGTTDFIMTVTNGHKSASCKTTVTTYVPETPLPDCTLSASPMTVQRGSNTVLSWTTTNADTAVISSGVGNVTLGSGSREVTPAGTTNYILTVTKGDKSKHCPVTVTVTEQPPAPVCTLDLSPTTIYKGNSATLTWTTDNATSVSIDQGIGGVDLDGNRSVSPTSNTTYTLTATGNGKQVQCTKSLVVKDKPVDTPFTCQNNVNFSANLTSIDEGDSTTLSWSVTDATSVSIDHGVNTNNAMSGSASVSPNSDTTYTLTATKNGDTISCPVSVNVDEDNGGGGGGSSTPKCELSASDRTIRSGDRVTLKWDTSRATSVEIKDNRNKVIVTTDGLLSKDKEDLYDGTITVRPTRDTTYTLTAARGSRDRDCTVKIEVSDTITQIRDQQPLVVSIPLTSVPYTGVDARAAIQMTVLGVIMLWGAYLGYMFYRREKVAVTTR